MDVPNTFAGARAPPTVPPISSATKSPVTAFQAHSSPSQPPQAVLSGGYAWRVSVTPPRQSTMGTKRSRPPYASGPGAQRHRFPCRRLASPSAGVHPGDSEAQPDHQLGAESPGSALSSPGSAQACSAARRKGERYRPATAADDLLSVGSELRHRLLVATAPPCHSRAIDPDSVAVENPQLGAHAAEGQLHDPSQAHKGTPRPTRFAVHASRGRLLIRLLSMFRSRITAR